MESFIAESFEKAVCNTKFIQDSSSSLYGVFAADIQLPPGTIKILRYGRANLRRCMVIRWRSNIRTKGSGGLSPKQKTTMVLEVLLTAGGGPDGQILAYKTDNYYILQQKSYGV